MVNSILLLTNGTQDYNDLKCITDSSTPCTPPEGEI